MAFDVDANGSIDRQELMRILGIDVVKDKRTEREVDSIIKEARNFTVRALVGSIRVAFGLYQLQSHL